MYPTYVNFKTLTRNYDTIIIKKRNKKLKKSLILSSP
jgi:hypothetical protein